MKKKKWFQSESKKDIDSHSWFNMFSMSNNDYNDHYENHDKPINQYLSCKTIQLFPNKNQKEILLKWMDLFIDMYNDTNYFINNNIYDFDNNIVKKEEKKEYLNFIKLRNTYLKDYKKNNIKNKIATHLIDEAIKHNVSKHKTCITNYFSKNIKFFRLRNMKKDRRKKILIIESGLFSKKKNGFCITRLGEIRSSEELKVSKTSVLQYDKYLNKFLLYVPYERESINIENRIKCGIDPGIRTFLTCYSEKEILEIGDNDYKKYNKYQNKIDKIRELFSNNMKNKKSFKKGMNHYYDKIKNMTKDLHFKCSKYLCERFNTILIGKISTKDIVSNKNNLDKRTKRSMLSLCHFRFREILEYQCKKYNTELHIVDESYTTKTCHNCDEINEVGRSKVYECKGCGMKCGRDINASINIYRK